MNPCQTRYSPIVRVLVRQTPRFFAIAAAAAVALRLFFVIAYPHVTDDSRVYADIAKNWLTHGTYAITDSGQIVPTYMRLPGYPAFLAILFALFGRDNFEAVLLLQVLVDLGTCFVIADLARRISGARSARAAFLLAGLCPFLANYAAAALTETLEIFFTALALNLAVIGLSDLEGGRTRAWALCGLAIFADIVLRPDGGILLAAIGLCLGFILIRKFRNHQPIGRVITAGVVVAVFSLGPLIPWTIRNFRVFHRFQPLTSRYATGPEDFVPLGFNHWVKTWMADYVSVEEIYWQEPGAKIDPDNLPSRAFDSFEQKQATREALDWYNENTEIEPELDAQFDAIAKERVAHSRFRYYIWLPFLRIADMWLRPRTELLPPDPRWWEFTDDTKWMVLSLGLGIINLGYIVMAFGGVVRVARAPSPRWEYSYWGLLLLFVVIRSAFLGTLENPEPRYVLECYPVVILCVAALFRERSV
jgi:4-amino-4-deoxy-L-arabinose transferase-like glycosyltransferase